MKLTARKADELVWQKWDWHYHNPMKGTWDWPEFESMGGEIPHMKSFCPYCEYYLKGMFFEEQKKICKGKCPLGITMNESCIDNEQSWFHKWCHSKTPKTRKKYAKLIRDVAGKRLGKKDL